MAKYAQQVHAFEPWGHVRKGIEEKVQINALANVVIHPVGLGERTERLPYYEPLGANTGTGSFDASHATDRNRLLGHLEIMNGDEYLESRQILRVDLIKIDVEGWEKYVLLGLSKVLARDKPSIVMEVSETTLHSLNGIDDFARCIPEFYEALYINFASGKPVLSPFDLSRPGDVLIRVRAQ
jgi:FkbM family methyltransferase